MKRFLDSAVDIVIQAATITFCYWVWYHVFVVRIGRSPMTGLTQTEFALALITAGSLLLIARYWRFFLALALFMILFGNRRNHD